LFQNKTAQISVAARRQTAAIIFEIEKCGFLPNSLYIRERFHLVSSFFILHSTFAI
jgi:hypothetical protein